MRLPNASSAILDITKLVQYCLSEAHPLGRHKARVFKATLAITASDADWLRREILLGLAWADAEATGADAHGMRYRVDLTLRRHRREAVVRTVWIIAEPDDAPRFVTCWIL
jgi:hypothetical protein